jgi:regulatory protein
VARRRPRRARAPREQPTLDAKAAKLAAFDLLARKSWSRAELTRRLKRRGAPDDIARAVVAELTERGYVDDAAFARWWAEARARGRKVGSARLRRELAARGIPATLAAAAVAAAFEETPEAERAMEAARRRLPALLRRHPERAPARLRDYLLRRGYPAAVVIAVTKRLLADRMDDAGTADDDGAV